MIKTFKEATKPNLKTVKSRIEYLRTVDDTAIKRFFDMLDNTKTAKEVHKLDYELRKNLGEEDFFRLRDMPIGAEETALGVMHDACNAKESEFNRAAKEEKKAAIQYKKSTREEAKAAVSNKTNKYMNLPVLKKVLDEISESFWSDIHQAIRTNIFNTMKKVFDDTGKYLLVYPDSRTSRKEDYVRYDRLKAFASKYVKSVPDENILYRNKLILKSDWKAIVETEAKDIADMVIESFQNKMAFKLGEVIDRKGGTVEINKVGSLMNHTIRFKFEDNSSFVMDTKQVIAQSKYNVVFARYPLTFHDVTFADGTKMKTPSAEKMQKEFGISDESISTEEK